MRVLLTTDTIGGVWTFTKDLTSELLSRGHAVALISFGRAPSPSQAAWCATTTAQHRSNFIYVSSLAPLEWMNDNERAYDDALPVILRLADKFPPDIIHSNQFSFGRLPLSTPTVVTAHSDVLSWAEACQPEGLEPSLWLTQYKSLVEQGLAESSAVIAPTRWMLDALRRNFTLKAPTRVILNGRSLTPSTTPCPRRLQAVSVGRLWDKAKNISLLTEVTAPISILIAGENRHENVHAPEHTGQFQMLGQFDEADLLALFRTSSLYLAPSIYEPFGLAPLEAAQCGCAVLANDIPSLRQVWGDAALYFNNATTLNHLLTHLLANEKVLLQARRKSLRRALRLTATRMADQYLTLYNEFLPSKPEFVSYG